MNPAFHQKVATLTALVALVAVACLLASRSTISSRLSADANWRSSPPVSLDLLQRIEAGMTRDQVSVILGSYDSFFFSFSLEEYYGEWTVEYFMQEREFVVGSVRTQDRMTIIFEDLPFSP